MTKLDKLTHLEIGNRAMLPSVTRNEPLDLSFHYAHGNSNYHVPYRQPQLDCRIVISRAGQ
jgi:hypothetical protein